MTFDFVLVDYPSPGDWLEMGEYSIGYFLCEWDGEGWKPLHSQKIRLPFRLANQIAIEHNKLRRLQKNQLENEVECM